MTLSQLEIFVCVAELKSFTLAAKHFGISQSAVSHTLKSLENHWKVLLFSRHQQQIVLTDIGQQLLQHAQHLLHTAQIMQQEAAAAHGVHQGSLKIGSFGASASIHLLPELLKEFRQRYPHIEIFVEEGTDEQVADWIQSQHVDVGFAVLPKQEFDTFPVMQDIFVALIPNSYAIAAQPKVNIADLAEYPFILTRAGSQTQVELLFKLHQIQPKVKYQLSQLLTILNMVNMQEGVSIVADMAITPGLLSLHPHVVKRPLSPNIQRHIGLGVANKRYISPATKAFIELSQEMFATHL